MPTYVKTDYVPDEVKCYLTEDKLYKVAYVTKECGKIIADDNKDTFIRYDGCAHLNGRPWTVINRP